MGSTRLQDPYRSVLIYSPQFNTIGGIETHIVNLSCLLARNNWHVTLVTTSGMLDPSRVTEMAQAGVEFIAPCEGRPLSVPRKIAWLGWLAQTRLARRQWDVIYTNAQGSLSWLLRGLKRNGTRLLHHYHTAGDERDRALWGRLFPIWMGNVDEIIACSTATAQNLRRVLGDARVVDRHGSDKMRVLRYLSAELPVPAERPARPQGQKLRFGFVGRLVKGKGIDTICQLSEDPDLKHVEWHLHGCGADYQPSYFENFSNLKFHGPYAGSSELSAIHSGLDAIVLFSRYQEGQPLALIEAMAAGLPWIATDQGGTRELMWSPTNCRLLPSKCTYEEAKQAVLDMAKAIHEGKTSIAAQRRAYDDHLSPQAVGTRWMEFLCDRAVPDNVWQPAACVVTPGHSVTSGH